METWKHGNMETLKQRNIQTFKHLNIQTFKHSNIQTFKHSILKHSNLILKGTVRVISSDPSCKDSKARFITIPLNLINNVEDIGFFLGLKVSNFYNS